MKFTKFLGWRLYNGTDLAASDKTECIVCNEVKPSNLTILLNILYVIDT